MANEKRLIDANAAIEEMNAVHIHPWDDAEGALEFCVNLLHNTPPVEAVEVPDKKLLKAIKLLMKQYEHSKNSEYVHHPIAHAFFHTWKQLDERRE